LQPQLDGAGQALPPVVPKASRARRALPWLLPSTWAVTFGASAGAVIWAAFFLPSAAPVLVQVLTAVASGPPIALVILFAFGIAFRPQIAALIERLKELSVPGLGVSAFQHPLPDKAPPPAEVPTTSTTKADEPKSNVTKESAQKVHAGELEAIVAQRSRETRFWFEQFLAAFLQPVTQNALRWLLAVSRDKPVPYSQFLDFLAANRITDGAQQANVWNALRAYNLVEANGYMVNITPAGHAFLKYVDGEWRPLEQDDPQLN
jgi:hypothetical protein